MIIDILTDLTISLALILVFSIIPIRIVSNILIMLICIFLILSIASKLFYRFQYNIVLRSISVFIGFSPIVLASIYFNIPQLVNVYLALSMLSITGLILKNLK